MADNIDELLHLAAHSIKYDGNIITSNLARNVNKPTNTQVKSDSPPQEMHSQVIQSLDKIAEAVKKCTRCELHIDRTHTVAGEGVSNPDVVVIGEAPGKNEDEVGRPFVGLAGEYLDKWLTSINLSRTKNVFITNTVKCRPLNNRDPNVEEYTRCNIYLARQVALLKPKCILALGRIAGRILSGGDENTRLADMRNKEFEYNNISVFVTYHPSAVLRNSTRRSAVWQDLQRVRQFLDG